MVSGRLEDLLDRRVPQYVAVYLGASWALIEFFAFLEDRFLLSPHLTNLVLSLLVLLLPSVLVFTYNHGRPGADRWRRGEKIFIPANLLAAAVVLFAGFSGKDLGAVTTTVNARDEEGNTIERGVPKSEFRKRLALFPLDAPPDSAWLGEAVAMGLFVDLFQDVFIDARPAPYFVELLKERGLSDAAGIPRPLKREIARELNLAHFLDGAIETTPIGYRIRVTLHDAERGDLVSTATFEGERLLGLVDSASIAVRRALDLPDAHIAENQDLPVSELTTESLQSFRRYAEGIMALTYDADFAGAAARLEEAARLDSTFALAHASLYEVRVLNEDEEGAEAALRDAMRHLYRLPERLQFAVKAEHYAFHQDFPKAFAVYEMQAELYPQDIQAQLSLAEIRIIQDDLPGAIGALEAVLELDPTRVEMLRRIGELDQRLGRYSRAEERFERYAAEQPDRPEPYMALGALHVATGEHQAAKGSYERALLVDPDKVEALVALAELDCYTGAWDEADRRARTALEAARTPQERMVAYQEMERYHDYRGDYDRALEYHERMMDAANEYLPPLSIAVMEIVGLGNYVRAGRGDEARARLERLAVRLPAAAQRLTVPIGRTELWLALEEPDSIQAGVEQAERAIESTGFQALAQRVVHARGRMHELRGEWPDALAAYRREREMAPSDMSITTALGRVHRELADHARAESVLLEALAVQPSSGPANYELGLVYLATGRPEDAVRHLERAVDAWAIADPGFERAADARARLDEARLRLRAVRPRG